MMDRLDVFYSGAAIVDLEPRTKLLFRGPQALWFLDQLLSNKLDDLEHESGREALLLTPKGKIRAMLRVLAPSADVYADADGADPQDLVGFFQERVFTTRVEIEDVSSRFNILSVLGPSAADVVNEALQRMYVPEKEHGSCLFAEGFLVRVERPVTGVDIWVRSASAKPVFDAVIAAGAEARSQSDLSDVRVLYGTQVVGVDTDESFLPQEAALERAVSFNKGCYLGQEAVAMAQRGRVKRRLRHLRFTGPPAAGDAVYEGAAVGAVSRIAVSPGGAWAIASVKTTVPVGATVMVDGASAEVSALPGSPEGPAVPSGREIREQLQKAIPPA